MEFTKEEIQTLKAGLNLILDQLDGIPSRRELVRKASALREKIIVETEDR